MARQNSINLEGLREYVNRMSPVKFQALQQVVAERHLADTEKGISHQISHHNLLSFIMTSKARGLTKIQVIQKLRARNGWSLRYAKALVDSRY